jgi:hypothetical protein
MKLPSSARAVRAGFLVMTAGLVTAGCDDVVTDPGLEPPDEDATTLSVYLTDAPGDVADVWIEIDDVVLVGGPDGPVSLLPEPMGPISLLDLENESMLLVGDIEVEPGTYSQLRFMLGGAVLETVDGRVYAQGGMPHPGGLAATGELHCPSCAQSGLKVQFSSGLVLEEGRNGVLLDFDVAQSFGRQAGQSGRWVMRPLIKGVAAHPDDLEDGPPGALIRGTVALATDAATGEPVVALPVCGEGEGAQRTLADFVPRATTVNLVDDEMEPIRYVGSTGEDGAFSISVLEADEYALDHWGEIVLDGWVLAWEAEVTPASVNVPEGAVVDGVSYTVTGASCTATD